MSAQTSPQGTHDGGARAFLDSAKVLIVDDEPDIVDEVIEQLEGEGLACLSALDAKSALALVDSDPEIGVIVTDIRMPGMDGLEMARQMKANAAPGRDLFVIVVTGHAGMKEAVEALQLGAEDFLTKPISPDHLLHSVLRAEEMIQLRQHERSFQQQLKHEVLKKTAELNASNAKLVTANQIKDQFLSVMGHELRTPLNAIIGFAELLKERAQDGDATTGEYLDYILHAGARLSKTIENILEFSTSISGAREVSKEWHILEDILGNVMGEARLQAHEKNTILHLATVPQDQMVEVDATMLIKALSCLVDNAIRFSPDGSTVTIGAERSADALTIYVEDHGCGMTDDDIALAKQPLRQVNSTLSRPAEGTGIGLTLAMLLIELQGGRVDIDSTPNVGTTVRIVIEQSAMNEAVN